MDKSYGVGGGGGLEQFSGPQSLLVLDLIWTWLGLGQGGFGTKCLGTGLDNFVFDCLSHYSSYLAMLFYLTDSSS